MLSSGFTLAECLTVIALMGVLASVAVVSGGSWFTKQESQLVVDQLTHELQFARLHALLRKTIVTLCPTLDYENCADQTAWAKGYLIFEDPAGLGDRNDTTTLLYTTRLTTLGTLTNTRDIIQFSETGFSRGTNSTFTYTADDREYRIIINLQGRIRVQE